MFTFPVNIAGNHCRVQENNMENYLNSFQVIWADIDANRHLRHTAYNDYAAQVRVNFFADQGYDLDKLAAIHIGPILFREETVFLKEIGLGEKIEVGLQLKAMRADGSRWKIIHHVYRKTGVLAATITVEGAWIDLVKRKLVIPPSEVLHMVEKMPKSQDFEILPDKKQ